MIFVGYSLYVVGVATLVVVLLTKLDRARDRVRELEALIGDAERSKREAGWQLEHLEALHGVIRRRSA